MVNNGFFITGTDTGIGKTCASTCLMQALKNQGHSVLGMKPVASGATLQQGKLLNDDARLLQQHGSKQVDYELINPYVFEAAIAPHLAAKQLNVSIDFKRISSAFSDLSRLCDYVVVEGVGGWQAPLDDSGKTLADLGSFLALPVILVVGIKLGCLNHALLSAAAIQSNGCHLAGWVANKVEPDMPAAEENILYLQQNLPAPWLGTIPHFSKDMPISSMGNYISSGPLLSQIIRS